jgi:hypothetical protein
MLAISAKIGRQIWVLHLGINGMDDERENSARGISRAIATHKS